MSLSYNTCICTLLIDLSFQEPVRFYCRGRALCNSLYELNATQASIRPTAGETYNEIENEPVSIEQYNL